MYTKCSPGSYAIFRVKKISGQGVVSLLHMSPTVSRSWPVLIVNTSRRVISLARGSMSRPSHSGKYFSSLSAAFTRPSSTANPMAVEVKVLLTEYTSLLSLARKG